MSVKCHLCDKKFTTQAFMESHADESHPDWRTPKCKGWVTPWGFADFREPVTYQHACDFMKEMYDKISPQFNQPKEPINV